MGGTDMDAIRPLRDATTRRRRRRRHHDAAKSTSSTGWASTPSSAWRSTRAPCPSTRFAGRRGNSRAAASVYLSVRRHADHVHCPARPHRPTRPRRGRRSRRPRDPEPRTSRGGRDRDCEPHRRVHARRHFDGPQLFGARHDYRHRPRGRCQYRPCGGRPASGSIASSSRCEPRRAAGWSSRRTSRPIGTGTTTTTSWRPTSRLKCPGRPASTWRRSAAPSNPWHHGQAAPREDVLGRPAPRRHHRANPRRRVQRQHHPRAQAGRRATGCRCTHSAAPSTCRCLRRPPPRSSSARSAAGSPATCQSRCARKTSGACAATWAAAPAAS